MPVLKRIIKNSFFLISARFISIFFSMIFGIYAARRLGGVGYGRYSFIIAYLSYFLILSCFELKNLLVRDIAQKKEQVANYLFTSILFKLITSAVSIILLYLITGLMHKETISLTILVASLSLFPIAIYDSFEAVFRAFERMEYITICEISYSAIKMFVGVWLLYMNFNLTILFLGIFSVEVLKVCFAALLYRFKISKLTWSFDRGLLKYLIAESYMLAIWGVLGVVYYRVDIIILSLLKDDAAVGWYSAAININGLITMTLAIAISVLLPVMSQYIISAKDKLIILSRILFKYVVLFLLPILVFVTLFAHSIIILLYGQGYQNSVLILKICVWQSLFLAILGFQGTLILISAYYKRLFYIFLAEMVMKILVLYYLIRYYSYWGAAIASVLTGFLSVLIYIPVCRQILEKRKLISEFRRPFILLIIITFMQFILHRILGMGLLYVYVLGLLVYVLLLFRLKIISEDELAYLKELIPSVVKS